MTDFLGASPASALLGIGVPRDLSRRGHRVRLAKRAVPLLPLSVALRGHCTPASPEPCMGVCPGVQPGGGAAGERRGVPASSC